MTSFPIVYKFLDEYTNNFTAWLGLMIAVTICLLMFTVVFTVPVLYAEL
jgi:hypothetical protein